MSVAPGHGPVGLGSFAGRLERLVHARQSSLVLGLDPDPDRLWTGARDAGRGVAPGPRSPAAAAALAVAAHCRAVIAAAGAACVAVKPQLACFERLGAPGWEALEATCDAARGAGLLVLADGKRGDVPVTAAAYAQALVGSVPTPYGPVAGLGADAFTANPLLGRDALEPLVRAAREAGAGVFILVRSSNPGAGELQDRPLASGGTLAEALARVVADLGGTPESPSGLGAVGAVVGATAPAQLARLRALMPHSVLLLPGIGAQGGRIEDLAVAWSRGPASALVSASRSIAGAAPEPGGSEADAARRAAEELRAAAWSLAGRGAGGDKIAAQ